MDSGQLPDDSVKMFAAIVKEAVNLRRLPEIDPNNIDRILPAGTNVSISHQYVSFNDGKQWYYVTGRNFHGWVDGEFLK